MNFYDPTQEHLTRLSEPWCASYSGGKDSTSLVTWVEWLRRAGWLTVERPQLVRSDTGVEDPNLVAVAEEMTTLLERYGWECALVRPAIHERLYNRILGIGNTPIHPGIQRMRWCTRATKVDPMERWRRGNSGGLSLTGLRLGESAMRDGKLRRAGCAAGGECGIPDPGEGKYSPILHWKTCQVVDWLSGGVGKNVRELMGDVFAVTRKLVAIYDVERKTFMNLFGEEETEISASRFGCVGCPAIQAESRAMEVRKRLFERVMDIQRRAGVVLITPEDEAFIRDCWERKIYPRGWSEKDEATAPPSDAPLFDGVS